MTSPTHPHQMLDGLHTPASTMLAQATSPCRSVVSSTTLSLMALPTPSLLPVTPIHSKRLLHQGSACDASHHLVVYAGVIALMLPIKWILFFAGNVIGLALPTNLLVMNGIKRGGEGILFLILRDSPFSSSLVLWKTVFSWLKFNSFCLPFFFYLF